QGYDGGFWASWCPPCRREAPALADVYERYRTRGVEFVRIDIWDDEKDARAYVQRYGIGYPNGLDRGGEIAIDYGVTGIPEKLSLDRDGRLVRKFVGPMDADTLEAILDQLLGEAGAARGRP
ncbi:MAG: TlpA family protein disulfide reductase, partial [Gemmatimonadetes bacterium]|nr:TlpA family protein disulfide reductase [Gemmatimonadota bacterium]